MIVLNFLGTRLIDVAELQAIAWCSNSSSRGTKNKVPVDSSTWTACVPEKEWSWCVTAFEALTVQKNLTLGRAPIDKGPQRVQISRMFKTWEEANALLIAFATQQPIEVDFFHREWVNNKKKTEEKDLVKSCAPTKGIALNPALLVNENFPNKNVKDAVITAD